MIDTHCITDGESSLALKSRDPERPSPGFPQSNSLCSEMCLPELAVQCLREIDNYCWGKLCTDSYSVELLRHARVEDDYEARLWVQYCFGGLVRGWLCHHPKREATYRLESEETYVTLAFERFWHTTTSNQRLEFHQLATALQNQRASLQGVILDTLRIYARPREVSLPEPGDQHVEESIESNEVWKVLKTMLPNSCEQRVAYLLFHYGLGPREIVRLCPQELSSVSEIFACGVSSWSDSFTMRITRNGDSASK
jgi:hypothetical protein